jgi:hypothetical protein
MIIPYGEEQILEAISGFAARQIERERIESHMPAARALLEDPDFQDRILLFMADLCELTADKPMKQLPHYGKYFLPFEREALERCCRVNDLTATANEILVAFEQYFPSCPKFIDGEWKFDAREEGRIHYVRHERPVIEGTLIHPLADALKDARLTNEEDLELEMQANQEQEEKKKATNLRRKDSRLRTKLGERKVLNASEPSTTVAPKVIMKSQSESPEVKSTTTKTSNKTETRPTETTEKRQRTSAPNRTRRGKPDPEQSLSPDPSSCKQASEKQGRSTKRRKTTSKDTEHASPRAHDLSNPVKHCRIKLKLLPGC